MSDRIRSMQIGVDEVLRLEGELAKSKAAHNATRGRWKKDKLELSKVRHRIADYCWEKRGHFASDLAAIAFGRLIVDGYYKQAQPAPERKVCADA